MDLRLLASTSSKCFGELYEPEPSDCDCLYRILIALKYYSTLKLDDSTLNDDILISFCDTVYPQFLNDYQHVICNHSHQLRDINDKIIEDTYDIELGDCNYSQCALLSLC